MTVTATARHTTVATLPDELGAEVNRDQWNGTGAHEVAITGLGSAAEAATTDFDASGAATSAVTTHEAALDPHPQYLTAAEGDALFLTPAEGNAAYDATGAATAAVATHVGLADPHTQYQKESEKDAANGYAGLSAGTKLAGAQQTYGALANTACEGNDARLSDARTPVAHKTSHQDGGSDEISVTGLSGLLADGQNALAIITTTGPTTLTVGAVVDGEFLKRVGATIVSANPSAGSTDIKATTVTVSTPALETSATVTDAGVSSSSQIAIGWGNCAQSDANHPGMGQVAFNAIAGTGQFTVELYSLDASKLFGAFKLNYLVG